MTTTPAGPTSTSSPSVDWGARLAALRKQKGLSQRELARRAGIPNGSLSVIEQGKVSPSIASLEKILAALPLELEAFFGNSPVAQPVAVRSADALVVRHHEFTATIYPEQPMGAQRVLQAVIELAPGGRCRDQWLQAHGALRGLVLGGAVELRLDGARHELGPGDGYALHAHHPHEFHNPGAVTVQLICWAVLGAAL